MQIVSIRDNLVSRKIKEKYFNISSAEKFYPEY